MMLADRATLIHISPFISSIDIGKIEQYDVYGYTAKL